MRRRDVLRALGSALVAGSCRAPTKREERAKEAGDASRIVFKHQPLWGAPGPFRQLIAAYERETGLSVVTEPLPNASDIVHQFFLTALEGGSRDFDVLIADVVWVAEFARAGWIADLSSAFPPDVLRRDFLSGAADSAIADGRTWAVPWYVDVGVLYRRVDLVPEAPAVYSDLEKAALSLISKGLVEHGYVWQGKQYEGLVCNAYESIWGHGGRSIKDGRVLLDTPEARSALEYMRNLLVRRVSPPSVTSQTEEESRRVFQDGRAAFMRNWPYAYLEAQRRGSPIRGKVALSPLPTATGEPGHGTLGGYLLALNVHSPPEKREAAYRFLRHLTSPEACVTLALSYGRNPPRLASYEDPRLLKGAPVVAMLKPMVERARPRPVTPYYPMISDVLQSEFSAVLADIRSPAEALSRAQALIDHITGEGQ